MKIELIPVIEISFHSDEIASPERGPYWEQEAAWEKYRQSCFKLAGLSPDLKSIGLGSSLFEVNSISEKDLRIILEKHFYELFENDEIIEEEIDSLDGGFILNINGKNELFPQCCGRLKDIKEWENICNGKNYFWIGHPFPSVQQEPEKIILECLEEYVPPAKKKIILDRTSLKAAIHRTKIALDQFSKKLTLLESTYQVKNLGQFLIHGN